MPVKTDSASIWSEYQQGLDYQSSMEFASQWPENVRFVEGKQWPAPTEKTKYMPRPVINQCDFTIDNKRSNILSQTLKLVFEPEELPEDGVKELQQAAQDISDMAQNTWNDIDQDSINEDLVNDTLILGTGIIHYYYDNSIKGGVYTPYVGKIQGEIIDPMDFFVANPHLKATQINKQPWIMIKTKEDTDTLIEIAKKNGENWKEIVADEDTEEKYDSAKKDMSKKHETTCLTKYYKYNGQIYWTKVTKNAIVIKPRPLTPSEIPFEGYPIVVNVFKDRRKSIFGRSIIEDIIPNQKALNFGLGMMLLSVQQTAWPKIIAKVGALLQPITNEPGEILTDHNQIQGYDGIKYMQPPNFSSMPMMLTDKLMDLTRTVTGVTEVNSGEVVGANMAASAIIALQNQAKKPNENYQQKLFRTIKRIGLIWQEFYKCYYNMPRPIQGKDENGNEITKIFDGSKYADMGFGLKVDVGPGSIFNESLQVTIVENMYKVKDINKYQYVRFLPSNAVPQEMKHDFEKEEEQLQEQQTQQGYIDKAISQLSPEEQQELNSNPALMEEFINSIKGGMGSEMQPM